MGETERAHRLVQQMCTQFPARRACSYDERAAQQFLRDELNELGVETRFEKFQFNLSLYGTIALHFGVALVGSLVTPVAPLLGATLLLVAGVSYWADSSRNGYLLRRLLPQRESQNLLATLPANGPRRVRIVLPAHVDASFTGLLFDPRIVKRAGGGRTGERQPYFARSMELVTDATFVLGLLALGRAFGWIDGGWIRIIELLLTVPILLTFLLNIDVVRRDTIVPGAADNLSGVAAAMALLRRFEARPLEGVELVFAFTGCEEAGTGGAEAMRKKHELEWDPDETVIVGIDTVCNGELRWFEEGEMDRVPIAPWLDRVLRVVAASDERFHAVRSFRIPVGATDAMPFLAKDYAGVTLGCFDPEYGAPRHYHHPNDTPENVDPKLIIEAVDFIEELVRAIVADRIIRGV